MTTILKTFLIVLFAWIATMWPGAWTAFLMLLTLSAMFLGMAAEQWFAGRAERRTVKRRSRMPA